MVLPIAHASNDTTFGLIGGGLEVSTGYVLVYDDFFFEVASEAGVLVESDLTLPEDARLESAHFALAAEPEPLATIASVATVRGASAIGASSAGATIDFGRLVTVAGVAAASSGLVWVALPTIDVVRRWTGATWQTLTGVSSFTETVTDRLLVETNDSGVSDDELAAVVAERFGVRLPAVPTALELLVNGTTVWFERQGSSAIDLANPDPAGGVGYVVDRTDAVRDAFTRAPASGGSKTVRLGLRAGTPGKLSLGPSIAALRVHTVAFPPDGLVRSVDLQEEGEVFFDVTPPEAADVREVTMTVRGSFGPTRVQPPLGPVVLTDAHLALAPGRTMLIGLPDELTSRFGKLTGVRLVLRAVEQTNGGQVTGRLLADAAGRPGEPLPGGDLTPVTVGPGPEKYWTLSFAEEVDPPVLPLTVPPPDPAVPRISAWLELQLGHGAVECGFTNADPNDPVAPGGLVLRRLPGGGTAELTPIPVLGPLRAAVRVVGTPDRDRPIPAVVLGIDGTTDIVGVTPTPDNLATRLTLATPLTVSGPVALRAVVAAPGTLTLDTVQVTYREAV